VNENIRGTVEAGSTFFFRNGPMFSVADSAYSSPVSGNSLGDLRGILRALPAGMPSENFEPLRARTFQFSVDIVRYCRCLPDTLEARRIADQLFRAGTAVAANYQAAGRGRSDREFIARIGTVVEESDSRSSGCDC
jgi:23S rRNA-intervening sequence protein